MRRRPNSIDLLAAKGNLGPTPNLVSQMPTLIVTPTPTPRPMQGYPHHRVGTDPFNRLSLTQGQQMSERPGEPVAGHHFDAFAGMREIAAIFSEMEDLVERKTLLVAVGTPPLIARIGPQTHPAA